jgi:hypothetical protein
MSIELGATLTRCLCSKNAALSAMKRIGLMAIGRFNKNARFTRHDANNRHTQRQMNADDPHGMQPISQTIAGMFLSVSR